MLNLDILNIIAVKPPERLTSKKKPEALRKKKKVTVTGDPKERRRQSTALIVNALKASGAMSINEIALVTGLAKSCVRTVLDEFRIDGYVTGQERKIYTRGKPVTFYSLGECYEA
jgi:predicted transcriptional regulator